MALAVHDGCLYAGTGWYDTTGSALEASPNTTPGGKVYRYDGGTEWNPCGALSNPETGEAATLGGLGVYKGALYATTLKQAGFGLYRYDGGTAWTYCGNPGRRVLNPCVFNGDLYMVSYDGPGGPFRYNGVEWSYVGGTIDPPISQDYSFAVYGGRLRLSTWPDANVYQMEDTGTWSACGKPDGELETMGMMVYNGKLYAGTLPRAACTALTGKTPGPPSASSWIPRRANTAAPGPWPCTRANCFAAPCRLETSGACRRGDASPMTMRWRPGATSCGSTARP